MKPVFRRSLQRNIFGSSLRRVEPEAGPPRVPVPVESETSRSTIHCDTHGAAAASFVCQHIVNGLIRHERVVFFWTMDDPVSPHPDAWRAECDESVERTDGEWEGEAWEHLEPKVLCGACNEIAKIFHMVGEPGPEALSGGVSRPPALRGHGQFLDDGHALQLTRAPLEF